VPIRWWLGKNDKVHRKLKQMLSDHLRKMREAEAVRASMAREQASASASASGDPPMSSGD